MYDVSFQRGMDVPHRGRLIYLLNQLCSDVAEDLEEIKIVWSSELRLDTIILTAWNGGVVAEIFQARFHTTDFYFFKNSRPVGLGEMKNILIQSLKPKSAPVGI